MKNPTYVLVVQHDPTHREHTRGLLEQAGHHVTAVPAGPAALQLAAKAERPYDAIVVDLALPAMSGLELAHRLHSLPGGAGAPVIGIAATEVPVARRATFDRWFAACLSEPLSRTALLETVAAAVRPAGAQARAV